MANVFKKIVDILAIIIVIVGLVLLYFSQQQDIVLQQVIATDAADFINTVTTQGKITKNMYEDLLSKLDASNVVFDINLDHKELAIEPEYRLKTPEEVIEDQNGSFTGPNVYHYVPVSTSVPTVTEPDNSELKMNDETNESVLAGAVKTPASPGHVHTSACYGGHVHTPVYGTNAISNVPVFIDKRFKDYDSELGAYTVTEYYVCCSLCGQVLFSFKSTSSVIRGKATYYYLNGSNVSNYSITMMDSTPVSGSTYAYIRDKLEAAVVAHAQGPGYGEIRYNTEVITSDFYWSETGLSGIPVFDTKGTVTSYQAITCPNIEGHPNTDGCFPVGKKGKVRITASGIVSSGSSAGYYNLSVNETCATCGRQILSINVMVDSSENTNFFSGVSTQFYDYNRNGQIITRAYNNGVAQAVGSLRQVLNKDAWNAKSDAVRNQITNLIKDLPKATGSYGSAPWVFTTPEIDSPFTEIPIARRFGDLVQITWEPYRGCVYCGTYGTAYSCKPTLICNKKVVSMSPTHPVQAVYTREPLITTATVTYLDGSTEVVLATTTFQTTNPVSNKTVTLEYTDATGQKVTCTISVTVVPRSKTCVNGHTYNLNPDGSDPGCPYCRAWLRSLEIEYPRTSSFSIYRGTTLKDNGVILLATYMDGRKEYIDSGYVDNLDRFYVGSQTVTISYKGKSVFLNVITKRNIIKCSVCGRYYELYPDDTDPGCPYCAARIPVFTGNIMKYYKNTYSEEILKEIYEGSGTYSFKKGDYFSVTITNKVKTIGTRLLTAFINNVPEKSIHVEYGSTIRDDGNR